LKDPSFKLLKSGTTDELVRTIIKSNLVRAFLLLLLVAAISLGSIVPSINGARLLLHPQEVVVDSSGNVYVLEYKQIRKFDKQGIFVQTFYLRDSGTGFAMDSSGNVFLSELLNNRITVFKLAYTCPTGMTQIELGQCLITEWGSKGTGNNQFNSPEGVAVDSAGNVFVADTGNHRIMKFKLANPCPAGTAQIKVGVCFVISWDNQFNAPRDLSVDSSGDVYVVDVNPSRIQKFKLANPCPAGMTQIKVGVCFVIAWGTSGQGNGEFKFPMSIGIDSSGHVFVADLGNYRIQKFKLANPCPAGTTQVPSNPVGGMCFVSTWGSQGPNRGQFLPNHVAVDFTDNVYVADSSNLRIQKFTNTGMYLQTIPRIKELTPQVTVVQSCITLSSIPTTLFSLRTGYGPYGTLGNSFQFDPLTQDMAIFIAGNDVAYGYMTGITGTAELSWMPDRHDVLVYVENKADALLHNHQLDVGYEFYATTTFKDPKDVQC
jgi:DNA-binding beta-propeller fold protein YncE